MLDYREIRPRAPVSSFVECFWTLAGPAVAPGAAAPEPILPDGCMELILNCAAPFRRHHTAATSERQPLRMLVGQMDRHVLIAPTGRVDLLGIRFHPAGARSLLHLPMSELAGRTLPLDEVARTFDRELACALDGSAASRVSRIESVLARRLAAATAHANPAVQAAVGELIRQEGAAGMDALARAAGLGPRQLERRFLDHVGLSPKCLARILRFQRVFRAVTAANVHEESDSGRPNWAAVAADCGYYDQAHLIRDFHQFAGQTPSLLLEAGAALTRYFTRSHRALHTR